MRIDDCSLDETLYSALKDDLITKRHTDMVFVYYNETTAMVEFSRECHRIALATKSRSLHRILKHVDHEIDNTTLIIVGKDGKPEAEALFNKLYTLQTSGNEINLWDNEEREEAVPEFDCKPENKYEPDFPDEVIKKERLDDEPQLEDLEFTDTFEDFDEAEKEECDFKMMYPKRGKRSALCEPPKVLTDSMDEGKRNNLGNTS